MTLRMRSSEKSSTTTHGIDQALDQRNPLLRFQRVAGWINGECCRVESFIALRCLRLAERIRPECVRLEGRIFAISPSTIRGKRLGMEVSSQLNGSRRRIVDGPCRASELLITCGMFFQREMERNNSAKGGT